MPTIQTFAVPENDYVKVHIPDEYREYDFNVVLVPVKRGRGLRPGLAGGKYSFPKDFEEKSRQMDAEIAEMFNA